MDAAVRIAGLCLAASVLASLLRKSAPELGLILSAASVLVCGALLLGGA